MAHSDKEHMHSHDGDHGHSHDHTEPPPELELKVKALESLLVEKGLVNPDALNAIIDNYEHKVGPQNGAIVVAKAWVDASFKEALLLWPARGASAGC